MAAKLTSTYCPWFRIIKNANTKRGFQIAGLVLWRFGLMLAGATALYRTAKLLLQFIDLPTQLEIGIGFVFSGAVIFMLSLIAERFVDSQAEGDLRR